MSDLENAVSGAACENAIEVKNLTKKYDGFTLDDISFAVPRGSIMGFIGQNGAGKSTTIHSMLNIIPMNSGEIKLLGMDHIKMEKEIKERTAVVFDAIPFHGSLNAKDMSRIFEGIYSKWDKEEYQKYLDRFQLPQKKKIGDFSKGMLLAMIFPLLLIVGVIMQSKEKNSSIDRFRFGGGGCGYRCYSYTYV